MIEQLIKRLWPVIKARVVALIAAQIIALAAKSRVTLTAEEAAGIAALVVALVEDLINRDDEPEMLAASVAAISSASGNA